MLYTIDIESLYLLYRLDKEGNFISLDGRGSKEVQSEDLTFNDYKSAVLFKSKMGERIVVDDKDVNCNSDSYSWGEPYVTINLHRTQKPKQLYFTKEQLNSVLAVGDDRKHNSLVIDLDGFVHLVPFREIKTNPYE